MLTKCIFRRMINQKFSQTLLNNSIRNISTEENRVIIKDIGDKGIIILNRPEAMNALNVPMIDKISPTFIKWEKEKKTLVIIKGNGKAFSAGGNIKEIAQAAGGNIDFGHFRAAYNNNGIVGSLKIPCISFIDGIVMGGAVGLAVLGRYSVATERTVLATPETQIGLIPDAGSSYILSRLPQRLGWYIGLTGARLKGVDILKAGLATHYTDSSNIPSLEEALLQCSNENDIKNTLTKFQKEDKSEFSLAPYMEKINYCFSAPTVEEIIARLEKDSSKWAEETITLLNKMSPTSLKVSHKELEVAKNKTLRECLIMEYRMAINCVQHGDFKEGVTALLVAKTSPKWKPATLKEVTDDIVNRYFEQLPGDLDLKYRL